MLLIDMHRHHNRLLVSDGLLIPRLGQDSARYASNVPSPVSIVRGAADVLDVRLHD